MFAWIYMHGGPISVSAAVLIFAIAMLGNGRITDTWHLPWKKP